MHHPVHKALKAAYSFYNVSTKTQWMQLMQDALIVAKNVSKHMEALACADLEISMLYVALALSKNPTAVFFWGFFVSV